MLRFRPLIQLLLVATLLLGTVLAYRPGLHGDFVFDDFPNILENKRLVLKNLNLASLREAAFSSEAGLLTRPISMASFALNTYFFGPHPYSFKIVNLIIHLLNGLAIYQLARLLLNAISFNSKDPTSRPPFETGAPLLLMGLWLLHPLNLTGVLYVVQRMTSLASLFMLAGMILYTTGRLRQLTARRGWPWLASTYLFCMPLAFFSKEIGVLLPLYLLVIEFCVFRFRTHTGGQDKWIVSLFVVTVAVPALLALAALATHPESWLNYRTREFTLHERLLTESRALLFYIHMLLMPDLTQLGLYHDDFTISRNLFDPKITILSLIFHASLIGVAFKARRGRPLLALGILWFYAGHLLESTILALELVHEHRNYLPSVGILLALIDIGMALTARLRPYYRQIICAACIALFAAVTTLRASQWADNISQAEYEALHHPKSARAANGLGRIYGRLAWSGQPGYAEKAFQALDQAMRLDPDSSMPAGTKILISAGLHRPVPPEWVVEFESRLRHGRPGPTMTSTLYELKRCQASDCQFSHDTMHRLFEAVLANPRLTLATQARADVLTLYGSYSIEIEHRPQDALAPFRSAVATYPGAPQYRINLTKLLLALGMREDARLELAKLQQMDRLGRYARDIAKLNTDLENSSQLHGG